MKVQKIANWILFFLFLATLYELHRLENRFESFGAPGTSQDSLEAYHRVVAMTLESSVHVAFGFAVATIICLALTQWRLNGELEQLKKELAAIKSPQPNPTVATGRADARAT